MGVLIRKSLATVINELQQIIQKKHTPKPVNWPLTVHETQRMNWKLSSAFTAFVTFTCYKSFPFCIADMWRITRHFHAYIDLSALIQSDV